VDEYWVVDRRLTSCAYTGTKDEAFCGIAEFRRDEVRHADDAADARLELPLTSIFAG